MKTRTMTDLEVLEYFADPNQRGLVAEHDGQIAGWCGWNRTGPTRFYAHSLFCDDRFPHAYACLLQELRRLCRLAGSSAIRFYVDADNAAYLDKVSRMRGVRTVSYVFELAVEAKG